MVEVWVFLLNYFSNKFLPKKIKLSKFRVDFAHNDKTNEHSYSGMADHYISYTDLVAIETFVFEEESNKPI